MRGPDIVVDLAKGRMTVAEGERLDRFAVQHIRRAGTAYGRRWTIVFDEALEQAARHAQSGPECKVIMWAMRALDPVEFTRQRQGDIALAIGLHVSSVSRALAAWRRRGWIQVRGDEMRLSLFVGWRGTASHYQRERKRRPNEVDSVRLWGEEAGQ